MSDVTKAVITDETAREILQEMQVANATSREARNLMSEQAAAMRNIYEKMGNASGEAVSEVYYVPLSCTATTADDVTTYAYELDGITFDDIVSAYNEGKHVVLKIPYGEQVFFAPMVTYSNKELSTRVMQKLFFFSPNNPEGAEGLYMFTHNRYTSDGSTSQTIALSKTGVAASGVSCSVTVGGTTYSNLSEALNALAAAVG